MIFWILGYEKKNWAFLLKTGPDQRYQDRVLVNLVNLVNSISEHKFDVFDTILVN